MTFAWRGCGLPSGSNERFLSRNAAALVVARAFIRVSWLSTCAVQMVQRSAEVTPDAR